MIFKKKLWIQGFSAATHSKMDENWLSCCCFQIFQLVFHYFWQFPGTKSGGKLAVFCGYFQTFCVPFLVLWRISDFFRNFWKKTEKLKFSEKNVTPEIFCCHPFKNGWKLVVLLLFSKCSASFSLLFGSSQVPKVAEN